MQYVVVYVDRLTGKWFVAGPFETAARASGWACGHLDTQSQLTACVVPLVVPDPD